MHKDKYSLQIRIADFGITTCVLIILLTLATGIARTYVNQNSPAIRSEPNANDL